MASYVKYLKQTFEIHIYSDPITQYVIENRDLKKRNIFWKFDLPERKTIPVAISQIGSDGKEFHYKGNHSQTFTTLGIVKFQYLWYLDWGVIYKKW